MKLELDIDAGSADANVSPRYAGFWIRFLAFVLDSIVLFVGLSIPFYFFFDDPMATFDLNASMAEQTATLLVAGKQLLVKGGIYLAIYVFCWMKFLGTPGKLILNTQIVDAKTLGPLTLGQSLIRYLGYFVSTFVFLLGFIWVVIDPKKRGFHDLMAGSVVIYKPTPNTKVA